VQYKVLQAFVGVSVEVVECQLTNTNVQNSDITRWDVPIRTSYNTNGAG